MTVCLNNMHQLGLATEYFVNDHGFYPGGRPGGHERAREFVCPTVTDEEIHEEMLARPLYPYLKPSDVFACPEDKGMDFSPDYVNYAPSCYYAFGCSYLYNSSTWKYTKYQPLGVLPGRSPAWVVHPTKYILLYEQPARPVWKIIGDICNAYSIEYRYYFHWHFNKGKTTITEDELANDGQKFVSPILFVEGHVAKHDFTRALKTEPKYPIEETDDWIWYQRDPNATNNVPYR